jgi:hypothetical protein
MPTFRIVVEETTTTLRAKEIEAPTLEEATATAEADTWSREHGWEEYDSYTNAEVRQDQCRLVWS